MTPTIVIITIAAYFAVLLGVSALARRNGATSFFGSHSAPWPVVTVAMVGAAISGVTFISVPGMVAAKGYSYLQMVIGFIVGYAVIAWVLVPVFYRKGLVSIYGYLEERFGTMTHRSGAWMFFISKMLGASVRFFVVCVVLQTLVFGPLGLPFELNVVATIALIWLYTARSGVQSVLWTDVLKSVCLILSVVLCIIFVGANLGLDARGMWHTVSAHSSARVFYFDNPMEASYFWKQFVAGVFIAIATNGLDQDMMQRNLQCRDSHAARKNMIVSGVMQFFIIGLFLALGTLLMVYVDRTDGLDMPQKSDELFGLVASHSSMPVVVGVLFVLGLVSAAYSAAGSALTSLTTSFTIDILGRQPHCSGDIHRRVHIAMSVCMGLVIIVFYHISSQDAISAVYTLASYTYGPILGLFAFGLATRRGVRDRYVPWVCLAAPLASWCVQWALGRFANYEVGFELLLINAALTAAGVAMLLRKERAAQQPKYIIR